MLKKAHIVNRFIETQCYNSTHGRLPARLVRLAVQFARLATQTVCLAAQTVHLTVQTVRLAAQTARLVEQSVRLAKQPVRLNNFIHKHFINKYFKKYGKYRLAAYFGRGSF